MTAPAWLTVTRGTAPLVVSIPHTGTWIPEAIEARLVSPWLARKDADWWIDRLYDFAAGLGATVIHTAVSRTVIDVNRDPSGASLYPGQATTGLCPVETFDGEPLYRPGAEPTPAEVDERRALYFDPYHAALAAEIARLRAIHPAVVLYDCHSIRSVIPRLFDGTLPQFNIGTNSGASCAPDLAARIEALADASGHSRVTNGRFKGGWITRAFGRPGEGVHAVQMELACRGYMADPLESVPFGSERSERKGQTQAVESGAIPYRSDDSIRSGNALGTLGPDTWPSPWDPDFAAPMRATLVAILTACRDFAGEAAASSEGPKP